MLRLGFILCIPQNFYKFFSFFLPYYSQYFLDGCPMSET